MLENDQSEPKGVTSVATKWLLPLRDAVYDAISDLTKNDT